MRLTKKVIQQILDQNEGFERSTHYKARNFQEDNYYKIKDGNLIKRSQGKTSWADSRYDDSIIADDDQTRRFIKKFLYALNTNGVD